MEGHSDKVQCNTETDHQAMVSDSTSLDQVTPHTSDAHQGGPPPVNDSTTDCQLMADSDMVAHTREVSERESAAAAQPSTEPLPESEEHTHPLFQAASTFDLPKLKELLENGCDANDKNPDNKQSAVHHMILAYRDMDTLQRAGKKSIMMEMVIKLAQKGHDINQCDKTKQTALHLAASIQGQQDIIKLLRAVGAQANTPDADEQTALHKAVQEIDINNVHTLVEIGCDVNRQDMRGQTPLHLIAKGRLADQQLRVSVMQHLLRCGANPNIVDLVGRNAMHVAAKAGCHQLVSTLFLAGARVNMTDGSGQSAVHLATKHDLTGNVLRVLLSTKTDINMQDGITKETPLHKALSLKTMENFHLLVSARAKPNIPDIFGNTPLHKAAQLRDIFVWDKLLRLGGNIYIKNNAGASPYQKVHSAKNQEALAVIEERLMKTITNAP